MFVRVVWRIPLSGPPTHICSAGCCQSREDSIDKATGLVQRMFIHAMSIPALNAWTTVAPCVNLVGAMQHFSDLLPQCFGASFQRGPQAESEGSEDEGAELGAPVDQTKVWRKLARKRQQKATHFLQDPHSQWLTLLWSVLTAPVMVVHYKLFKRGTWFTERPEPVGGGGNDALSFQDAAWQACLELTTFLLHTDAVQVPAWLPLVGFYGPISSWSQDKLRAVRRSILTLLGKLFRKLLEPWRKYPWKLVELPCLSPALRREKAHQFFLENKCCLDGFSLKLREIMQTEEALLEPKSLDFLKAVFERVVPHINLH